MERFRVVIATTAGPSLVKGLSAEDPGVHSVICLDESEQDLPISPAYHRFVRDPTGVIERHFKQPTWRMDVTDRIDAGNSWKLGVFVAHALYAAGRLADADDQTATALWLTGDVTRNLSVRPVGEVPLKLKMSGDFLAECDAAGRQARLFVPAEDLDGALDAAVTGVSTVAEVLEAIGLDAPAAGPTAGPTGRPGAPADQHTAELDFRALIREKRWNFTGREWLMGEIRRWIDDAVDERVLLLVGDPGAGKSALIAQMAESAAALHFCQSDTRVTLDSGRFIRSVAAMTERASPEVSAALEQPDIAEFMTAEASQIDPAAAFDFGLIRALDALPRDGRRNLILVDGLDESLAVGGRMTISELLGARANRLPPGTALIATTRPDPRVLDQFEGVRVLRLDAGDSRNLQDVRDFVAQRLSPGQVDRICNWSGGNFLYARHVVDSIARGDDILEGGGALPPGLDSLYIRLFDRHWPNGAGYAPTRKILSTVIAAREPLTTGQLRSALQSVGEPLTHSTLEALGPFLRVDGQRLEMFHASIVDWLMGPDARAGPFTVFRQEGEQVLAAWCKDWAADLDAYKLAHAASHLRAMGDLEGLQALVADAAFIAMKSRRPDLAFSLRDDHADLLSALLEAGRDADVVAMVRAGGAVSGAALAASSAQVSGADRLQRLVAALIEPGAEGSASRIHAVGCGLTIAGQHGMNDVITGLVRDPEPAVRSAVAATLYLIWRRDPAAGWTLLESIGTGLFSILGLPNRFTLDVLGGVTLALVGSHLDDSETMARLHRLWRGWISTALRRPAARIVGRKWATALAVPSLRLLLQRQPDYQPLNLAEIDRAVRLCDAHRDVREIAIGAIEKPQATMPALQDALCTGGLEFDVILMLSSERALILAGMHEPAATFDVLEQFSTRAPAWFRQSILYAGFHIARNHPRETALVKRFLPLSTMILGEDRALYATDQGTYRMVPHIAWAEVLARTAGLEPGAQTGKLLDQAFATEDDELLGRIIGGAEVLSLGYGQHRTALDILRRIALSRNEATTSALEQTLANIRYRAGHEVDTFLYTLGENRLLRQVGLTLPNVGAADFPTWMDDMFISLLVKRQVFRAQIAQAFRRASAERRTSTLLANIVPWVAGLIVDPDDKTDVQPV